MWRLVLLATSSEELSKNNLQTVLNCSKKIYPNVHIALKILVTLLLTTVTPIRCSASLKRLKTHLRDAVTEILFIFDLNTRELYYLFMFRYASMD